jgi:hypothetical protein
MRSAVAEAPPDQTSASIRRLRIAAILALGVSLLGLVARLELRRLAFDQPRIGLGNAFQVQYARFEPPFLLVLAICAALTIAATLRVRPNSGRAIFGKTFRAIPRFFVPIAAALVLVVAAAGTRIVFRSYPFAMDEFAADFQAKIFARGALEAPVAEEWRHYVYPLQPIFIEYRPATHAWSQTYLPVYAGIRAGLRKAGLDSWTNPILAAVAILLIASLARRLFPGDPTRVAAAVLLLATSSQFLFMSMSVAYAMPAHLALNLLWLRLYLEASEAGSWWRVGALGAITLGLHNPFPHFLFAAPFVLRLLREKRFAAFAQMATFYAAGAAGWWWWLSRANPYAASGRIGDLFALPHDHGLLQTMNLAVLFSWQAPLVVLLFLAAVLQWKKLDVVGRDLALGVAATFAFYALVPVGQIHGWGYRFTYAVLGSVVLVGLFGLPRIESLPLPALRPVLLFSCLVALVQIPVRAMQVRGFVGPFARASAYVQGLGRTAVVLDSSKGWFVQDLVRNDPFLEHDPKVFLAERFSAEARDLLHRQTGMPVREITTHELAAAGLAVAARAPD